MQLQYYAGIDVSRLSDDEWCKAIARLQYIRDLEKVESIDGKRSRVHI